jgi:acetyltransferase-like isoleucine patch superfamily enzyme
LSFDPKSLFWKLKEANPVRYLWAYRRAALIARIRLLALWHRSTVEIDLAPDLRLGKQLRVTIDPNTKNVLKIGPRSYLGDRVVFLLRGGEILLGPETGLRHDVLLNVSGRLVLVERNVLSWGCVLHCAEAVTFEKQAGAADLATIADSTHYFTEPMAYFYNNVRTAPIVIGANTWICPRASVVMGVTVGDHCIIGSNSVVTRDVPSGHMASGVPADDVRPIRLPWKQEAANG